MSHDVEALLSEVYHAGGRVAALGADLVVEARRGALSPELLGRLHASKGDVLHFIEVRNAELRRSILRSREYDPTRLTGVEKAFCLLHMLPRTVDIYTIAHHFRLIGELDEEALAWAINDLARTNEGLRTSFPADPAYGVVRHIHEPDFVQLEFEKLEREKGETIEESLERVVAIEVEREFDLENGPLFKARLISLGPRDHALLLTMHHSIGDAWSQDVLLEDLSRLYRRRRSGRGEPPRKPIRFADYARWYEDCLQAGLFRLELDYWMRKLERRTFVRLPLKRPYPRLEELTGEAGIIPFLWPAELVQSVNEMARCEHVTPFVVILTAYALTFSELLGIQRVPITNVTAGRHMGETRRIFGPFVNEVMVCAEIRPELSLGELIKCVSKELRESLANGVVHADTIAEHLENIERAGEAHPIPVLEMRQIALDLVSSARDSLDILKLDGTECQRVQMPSGDRRLTTAWEILTIVHEAAPLIRGEVWFMRDLFDAATVAGMLARFRATLEHMTSTDRKVGDLLEEVRQTVDRPQIEIDCGLGADVERSR